MSQYRASTPPGGQVPTDVQQFYERFYRTSDTPGDHDAYADYFTQDALLIMGPNTAKGRDEILRLRHGMWEKVAARSHQPAQIFAFGADAEYMLHGSVAYELKDGRKTKTDWAARAKLSRIDGVLKMTFYQVYLDTAAMARAT